MAAQYKTQCPQCGAQFRISEQHLAQAKGAVRCGSCLKVFQATDHLVAEPPRKAPAKAAAKPSRPAGKAAPTGKTGPTGKTAKPAAAQAPANKWSLGESAAEGSRWTLDENEADEAIPDKLVDEPEPRYPSNDTKLSLGGLELSESFESLDSDDEDQLGGENFADMAGAGKRNQSEDSDESWAEKLLEELDDKPEPVPVRADLMSLDATEEEQAEQQAQSDSKARKAATKAARRPEAQPDWAQDTNDDFFEDDSFGLLDDDDDEIAEIDLPSTDEPGPVRVNLPLQAVTEHSAELLKWGALSLAAIMVFSAQYLAFNYQELARTESWRPFYANICDLFGCQLPSQVNLEKLRGSNLIVRRHPSVAGALVVDVIVFNESEEPQPFPLIELGFTDLNGAAVASRRFLPEEYLSGQLANSQRMPAEVPVRLSLEILDPGERALNYTLRFLEPPKSAGQG